MAQELSQLRFFFTGCHLAGRGPSRRRRLSSMKIEREESPHIVARASHDGDETREGAQLRSPDKGDRRA